MKAIRLLLATIASVALVSAALYAVPANSASDQTLSESAPKANAQSNRPSGDSGPQGDARESGEHHGLARFAKPRPRPKRVAPKPRSPRPPDPQRSVAAAANPPNVLAPAPAQSAAVANRGSVQNEAIYRALPVLSGSARRPGTAGGSVHHRDPNPPVIGGAASSSNRNTAAIDGMQTNLKRSRN